MKYKLLRTQEFNNDIENLDNSEKIRVLKILDNIIAKGDDIGKPLAGLSFFREKKFNEKRIYFLFYSDILIVLAIAISDKKAQQATINKILLNLLEYQNYVYKMVKE